jgi:chromosome partitioning protein
VTRTLAIANHKGGSGKTTTAVNLSACLAQRDRRVLLIDLDAQASATTWLGCQAVDDGLLDVFTGKRSLAALIRPTQVPGLAIVPAGPSLVGAERTLASEIGVETILRGELRRLPKREWEYVLIDCPPALGTLTINALTAVREVLVPVEAHVMALSGLVQLRHTVERVQQRLNAELILSGVLACRVDGRTRHAQEVVAELRQHFGGTVLRSVIRENVRLAECPSFGQPITVYAPTSTGAADYRALADEVIEQERRGSSYSYS